MADLHIPKVNNRFVVRAIPDVVLPLLPVAPSGIEAANDGAGTAPSSVILQNQASWKNPCDWSRATPRHCLAHATIRAPILFIASRMVKYTERGIVCQKMDQHRWECPAYPFERRPRNNKGKEEAVSQERAVDD